MRKSKSTAEDTDRGVAKTVEMVQCYSPSNVIEDSAAVAASIHIATTSGDLGTHDIQLPGAIRNSSNNATPKQLSESNTDQSHGISELAQTPVSSCQTSPAAESPTINAEESFAHLPASPARFAMPPFTDEQDECFQASVLYLQLTVQGFSFSIGSHSRFCKSAIRILMSVKYISMLVVVISLYSGVPWLGKFHKVRF